MVFLVASIPLDDGRYKKFLYFGAFFFAGHFARKHWGTFEKLTKWNVAAYFAVGAFGFGILSAFMGIELAFRGEFAVFSLMGIIVAIAITKKSVGATWTAPVSFIGRNSLIYYVSHFPIILCVLYAQEAGGIQNIWAIAIPGLVLSFAAGTVLAKYRHVRPIQWFFQAPTVTARNPPAFKSAT